MKCDPWASYLARTFASLCFGREPKARVAIVSPHGFKVESTLRNLGDLPKLIPKVGPKDLD